ncbi:13332_t:CDS:2, partial [Entrophospora sp. SA101]
MALPVAIRGIEIRIIAIPAFPWPVDSAKIVSLKITSIPPVQTWLKASWDAPPLILEILETISIENSTSYFHFINELIENEILFLSDEKEIYFKTIEIISSKNYLSNESKSLLEFSLSIHSTTPTIQTYYNYYNSKYNSNDHNKYNNCNIIIDYYENVSCEIEEFKEFINSYSGSNNDNIKLLSFDHILKPNKNINGINNNNLPIIILYSDLNSLDFIYIHKYLIDLVNDNKIIYILRYKPLINNNNNNNKELYLSGYGVELALKQTDYIVLDDRNINSEDDNSNIEDNKIEDKLNDNLFSEEISEIVPLKSSEIKDFPKYSYSISQLTLNTSIVKEVSLNQHYITNENNILWLNGLILDHNNINPFSPGVSIELLTLQSKSESKTSLDVTKGLFDVRDQSKNSNLIVWFNDFEKDEKYEHWPSKIFEILRPVYPGQMRFLKKNLFTTLFVLDLSSVESLKILTEQIKSYIDND